jgi:hypothetical protein
MITMTETITDTDPNSPTFGQAIVKHIEIYDPPPRVLSKTSFQDYAISQLGGDVTGMRRFTEIMDATRDSTAGSVRFAFARYEAALTFEKENTAALTAIMAADSQTGHITSAERAAILDSWPLG